jgi:subtilisin-like proprotein convertase family protein
MAALYRRFWILLSVGMILFGHAAMSAPAVITGFWTDIEPAGIDNFATKPIYEPASVPNERLLAFDIGMLSKQLSSPAGAAQNHRIALPYPGGGQVEFSIEPSTVLPPGLASRYPAISVYKGVAITDSSMTVRLEVTERGVSAQVIGSEGRWAIDPMQELGPGYARSFMYQGRASKTQSLPMCEVEASDLLFERSDFPTSSSVPTQSKTVGEVLKTYTIAIATTGEYGVFHGGTTASVLAAVTVLLNRVDGIFQSELGIGLQLAEDNDRILFTASGTDPFDGNNDASTLIDESQAVIDAELGSESYDVGHTLSTGAGGLAQLGVVCRENAKARGVTGLGSPTGDYFYVDFVAHELGHQFAAFHTWNGEGGNCSPEQRTDLSAYEPGSGSSIMSYAGLCGADNIEQAVDALFHHQSFEEIITYTADGVGASCGTEVATGNAAPSVNAGQDFVVPKQTALVIEGSASDEEQTSLLYSWEQRDLGPQAALSDPDDGEVPLFRMLNSRATGVRYLPALSTVVAGGASPKERIPQLGRDMQMRLTVKDGAGGVQSDDIVITVDENSGPFEVIAPNGGERVGSAGSIRWNSAFTEQAPINALEVDVFLSLNNGGGFPQLIGSYANNGQANIEFPSGLQSQTARLMIRGSDNVFYDVSDGPFQIDTDRQVPEAPVAVAADAGDSQITLTFTPGPNGTVEADSYEAYCETESTVTETPFRVEPALPFDENTPIFSELVINEDIEIQNNGLRIPVEITHEWRGDVVIDLTSPSGTTVRLKDSGIDPATDVIETYPLTALPVDSLAAFNGESTLGTWRLDVSDEGPEDVGTLLSWGITTVTTSPASSGSASGSGSPLVVSGLLNDQEYLCQVTPSASDWPGISTQFEAATPVESENPPPSVPTISLTNILLSATNFEEGDGDQVVLAFTAQSDLADAQLESMTVQAAGSLDDVSEVGAVKVFADSNADGVAEASELIREGSYASDNGAISFQFEPLELTEDAMRVLVTYEF